MYSALLLLFSPLLAFSLPVDHSNKITPNNIEFWSSTPPVFTCTTTSTSPTVDDILSVARNLKQPSQSIRVGKNRDTRKGSACVIAGTSGNAVVELCAQIGIGFPAMTPMRVAETVVEECKESVDGVMRAGGYAVFLTGTKVTVRWMG